ncbi:MAG: 30S ribosomal protein S9 [Candidatus Peregrinibacteria bacterium]
MSLQKTPAKAAEKAYFYALGKRKTAIAKVYLTPGVKGGKQEVNGKDLVEYFPGILGDNALSPLTTVQFSDISLKVVVIGGGSSSQSDAVRHGIARALELYDPAYRLSLKRAGLLTRDPRVKERKKPGLKKARRSPQWSKR